MTQDQDPSSLLAAANAAFLDETYTTARDLYSQLLTSTAPSAEILLKRATCNHNLAAFDSAVTDAEEALKLAGADTKTSAKAHMRVGMAYLELNRIQDAIDAFVAADGEGLAAGPWIEKCVKLGGKVSAPAPAPAATPSSSTTPTTPSTTATPIPSAASFLPPSKIRHEWFQTDAFVIVSIFVKNINDDNVAITFTDRTMSVTVKLPGNTDYSLELDPLLHEISPDESKYAVMKTKIEIKLKKTVIGARWADLEGEETDGPVSRIEGVGAKDDVKSYPSSSKKKPNWDAVLKEEGKDDKPEGEQALNALFQQIYKDANPDVKRAMMKSYVESNGTCLSTNWDEVGKKQVEVTPPEGMVAKKFEM